MKRPLKEEEKLAIALKHGIPHCICEHGCCVFCDKAEFKENEDYGMMLTCTIPKKSGYTGCRVDACTSICEILKKIGIYDEIIWD